jgi:hypothetical protein
MHCNDTRPPDRSVSESLHLTYNAQPTILVHPYPASLHSPLGDPCASHPVTYGSSTQHRAAQCRISMNADTTMQPARGAADAMEALLVSQRGRHFFRSTAASAPSSPLTAAENLARKRCRPGGPTSTRTSSCPPSRPTTRPSGSTSTRPLATPSLSQTTSLPHGTMPRTITLLPHQRPQGRQRPSHSSGLRAYLNPSSNRDRGASARRPTTTCPPRRRSPRRSFSALSMGRVLAPCGTRPRKRRTACPPSTRSMPSSSDPAHPSVACQRTSDRTYRPSSGRSVGYPPSTLT